MPRSSRTLAAAAAAAIEAAEKEGGRPTAAEAVAAAHSAGVPPDALLLTYLHAALVSEPCTGMPEPLKKACLSRARALVEHPHSLVLIADAPNAFPGGHADCDVCGLRGLARLPLRDMFV